MFYKAVFFVALISTALALGGGLAHAYEMLNKLPLSRGDYFTVQQIYAGWNRLGIVLFVELSAMISLAIMTRRDPALFWPVLAAIGCVVVAQAVFWIVTFPANVATKNWTTMPHDWVALRQRWEYSHLAGAIFQLLALAALACAALARHAPPARRRTA
jgi:hypothetical protein